MARVVTVLYFAGIKDVTGTSESRIELSESIRTVGDLGAFLERTVPALAGRLGSVRFALNESFVEPQAPVSDGDVIAVIPPVSGG